MPQTNGQGALASNTDGVRRLESAEQGAVVRPSSPPRPMAGTTYAVGSGTNHQASSAPAAPVGRVPRTLHRISFSASQVDALAKREALTELRASGLQIHNEMQFAQSAVVIRRDDGGLDVEVSG